MNKITKISFCFLSVFMILVSMCPLSAFAVDVKSFNFNFQKPSVDDYSGYAELLVKHDSGTYGAYVVSFNYFPYTDLSGTPVYEDIPVVDVYVYSNRIQFSVSSPQNSLGIFSICGQGSDGTFLYNYFGVTPTAQSYSVSVPANSQIISVHYYGKYRSSNLSSWGYGDEFICNYASDGLALDTLSDILDRLTLISSLMENPVYSSQLGAIIEELQNINFNSENIDSTLRAEFQKLTSFYDSLVTEIQKITSNTDSIDEWLDYINARLNSIWYELDDVNYNLEQLYDFLENFLIPIDYWLQELYWLEFDSNQQLIDINSKLNSILSKLEQYSDVTFPSRNNSELESYLDIENSLLDDSHIDPSKIFGDVTLNADAVQSVFGMFNDVVNVHPKIIGFIILVLGIGLVALILGR